MPFCTHCSAKIPAGRRYCLPHYQAALRDFTRRQAQFQQARAAWSALTLLSSWVAQHWHRSPDRRLWTTYDALRNDYMHHTKYL